MPLILEHIDAISRKTQRSVLWLRFTNVETNVQPAAPAEWDPFDAVVDWENHSGRQTVIAWFNKNGIPWIPCGDIANENCMDSYRGQIHIDVPYDLESAEYQQVAAFLENPDGSMRIPGVEFRAVTYEWAMKNAHHDEPGFWERWTERF